VKSTVRVAAAGPAAALCVAAVLAAGGVGPVASVPLAGGAQATEPSAPVPADAYGVATQISGWGPRPAASAREARAHRLMRRVFRGAGLRVGVQEFRVPGRGRSRNVIGVYDTPRSCLRIVMAHTDTTPAGPGANDNASGLGVVASLAGRLGLIEPWCDVWLVATGAEERVYTGSPDHLGALALARRARAHGARKRLRFALSLDEVGRDRPFWLRSPAAVVRPKVEGALLAAAGRVGTPVSWVRDESTGNSDHREFELLGLPGAKLGVGAGGEPCRHMACDRPSRLDRKSLLLARKMTAEALRAR
jgi:Peptidase family M28